MAVLMTATTFALLQTTGDLSSAFITSPLESIRCEFLAKTPLESYSCRKIGRQLQLRLIMLRSEPVHSKLPEISVYKPSIANSSRICTCEIAGLKLPLESAVPRKRWSALPLARVVSP